MRQVSALVLAVCANGILSAMAASVDQQLQIGPDASQRIVRRQVEKLSAGHPSASSFVQGAVHQKVVPPEPEVVNGNFEKITAGADQNGMFTITNTLANRIALAPTDGRADGWTTSGDVFLVPDQWTGGCTVGGDCPATVVARPGSRYNDTQGQALETCEKQCEGVYASLEGTSGSIQQTVLNHIVGNKYMLSFVAMSNNGQHPATMEVHLTGAVSDESTAHHTTSNTGEDQDTEPDFKQDSLPYAWTSYEFEYTPTETEVQIVVNNVEEGTTLLIDKFDIDPCKTTVLFLHDEEHEEIAHVEHSR